MTDTMRRWQMDAVGRDRLQLRQVPVPQPGRNEVLVRVAAVALNFRDKMVIENGRGLTMGFPFTPGSDLAGIIVALGDGATRFANGDRVISTFTPEWIDATRPGDARTPAYRTLGGFFPGVLADYVALPQDWLVRAPATLSDPEASTLPCAGLTAWFALAERGRVRPGENVLVEGTGGVSLFGLQIARMLGAEVIVSGSADKLSRAEALGADHLVDRRRKDWVDAVLQITSDRGVDHILELVGGSHLAKAVEVAAVGGHVYQIGALEGFEISTPVMPLLLKDVTIHGIATGHRSALERFVRAIEHTDFKPVIDTCYPITDLPVALDHLEHGALGKIVVAMV